jgi:pimeloyl-ACP methyl ester carboxylesterase
MWAHRPLENEEFLGNSNLTIPVSFYYGDRDWMDHKSGERIIARNRFRDIYSHVYIVPDSDHHMYMDNP